MNEENKGMTREMWVAVFNRLLRNEGIPVVRNYFILLFIVCIIGIVCGIYISVKFPYESYKGHIVHDSSNGMIQDNDYNNSLDNNSSEQENDDIINDDNLADDPFSDIENKGSEDTDADNGSTADDGGNEDLEDNVSNLSNSNIEDNVSDVSDSNIEDDNINSDNTQADGSQETLAVPDSRKRVYLTFDDGPGMYTQELLDILKEEDVKATFFVVGKTDDESIATYKRIVEEGHTLAIHSYTHKYSSIYKSSESFIQDFEKLQNHLYNVTGVKVIYHRFPGGSGNSIIDREELKKCIKYFNDNGIKYYDWNTLNGDAEGKDYTKEELVENVISGVKNVRTAIVLMHDSNDKKTTIESMPELIKKLKDLDVLFLPIDENTPTIQQVSSSIGG